MADIRMRIASYESRKAERGAQAQKAIAKRGTPIAGANEKGQHPSSGEQCKKREISEGRVVTERHAMNAGILGRWEAYDIVERGSERMVGCQIGNKARRGQGNGKHVGDY